MPPVPIDAAPNARCAAHIAQLVEQRNAAREEALAASSQLKGWQAAAYVCAGFAAALLFVFFFLQFGGPVK